MLLDDGAGTERRAPFVGALCRHQFSLSVVTRENRPHVDLFRQDEHPHPVTKILQFPSPNFPHFLPFAPRLFQFHELQQIQPGLHGFDAAGAAEGDVSAAALREAVGCLDLIGVPGPQQQLLFAQLHASTDSFGCDKQTRNGQSEALAVGSPHSLRREGENQSGAGGVGAPRAASLGPGCRRSRLAAFETQHRAARRAPSFPDPRFTWAVWKRFKRKCKPAIYCHSNHATGDDSGGRRSWERTGGGVGCPALTAFLQAGRGRTQPCSFPLSCE